MVLLAPLLNPRWAKFAKCAAVNPIRALTRVLRNYTRYACRAIKIVLIETIAEFRASRHASRRRIRRTEKRK